jgi:uncharacterized protein YodC (DUF2158 family)
MSIKIGSTVKLKVPNCPTLVVEQIRQVSSSNESVDGRTILLCKWFDNQNNVFKNDEFYEDTVELVEHTNS